MCGGKLGDRTSGSASNAGRCVPRAPMMRKGMGTLTSRRQVGKRDSRNREDYQILYCTCRRSWKTQ